MKYTQNILMKQMVLMLSVAATLMTAPIRCALAEGSFFIEPPKLGLGSSYENEEEKRTIQDTETKTTTHDIRENVPIGTGGWVYHPNLMKYRLTLEPEWRQESFRKSRSETGSTQNSDRDTSVLAYDAETTFLNQKPCSLDIFANRSTRKIDLSYTQDTDIDTETWGSRLKFSNAVLPVTVSFINRKSDQTGFYDSDEDRDQLQITIRHHLKRSDSSLNILQDDTEKTTRWTLNTADINSKTTNAEFTNTFLLTGDERVRLDSLLYLGRAEYNDVKMDTRLVTENFFWTLGKNLLAQYTANLNRREVDGFETKENTHRALLTHRLGDSLTTNFGAGVSYNDYDGGSMDRYRSDLGFHYRRPIPWGNIELGARYNYEKSTRSGTGKVIPVEERHVLATGEEALLGEADVAVESIVVTDLTGTIVYVENIDYMIFEVGPDVRISRSLLGAISDGQEVSIRYNHRVDAGYDDTRFGQDYRLDLALWSFINMTFTHRGLDQTIDSGVPPAYPVDDTLNSARLRLDTGWSETRFEYETQDRENGNSTLTKSVRELIHLSVFRTLSLHFSGHYGEREFTDTDEMETFYTYGTDIGWTPERWCSFRLTALRSNISGDRQDMAFSEISPSIQLRYGVWKASIAYRWTDQENRYVDNALWRQRMYFVVSRALW
jgi:hypothetical protein